MAPNQTEQPQQSAVGLQLPVGVVGPGDVRQLRRDLEALENTLQQMRLRTRAPVAKLPRATRLLEEFAATNRLNLLLPDDRQRASAFLAHTLKVAPVLHMSFAAEASRAFTTEIILWLRKNIAPDVLLNIGLEPTIAAGCVVRTPTHQYDFSLRERFAAKSGLLLEKIQAGGKKGE
jgi:F0F1-type ATP synthase delta subunit